MTKSLDSDAVNTGLSHELISNLRKIFSEIPSIEKVILYGSRAKGSYRAGSDIDLTFVGEITHQQLIAVDTRIDDLLSPYLYDLSVLSDIKNPALLEHIQRVGVVIYPS